MPLDTSASPEFVHTTRPHDCPSTCALEVERLSPTQIGRVRGAEDNSYTAGVIGDGARVRLGNKQGSVVLHARVFDGVQPEVVIVESIWPNKAFEEGTGINALTSAEPGLPRGGAVFHDTADWVKPA